MSVCKSVSLSRSLPLSPIACFFGKNPTPSVRLEKAARISAAGEWRWRTSAAEEAGEASIPGEDGPSRTEMLRVKGASDPLKDEPRERRQRSGGGGVEGRERRRRSGGGGAETKERRRRSGDEGAEMKEQALVKGRHGKFECGYGIGRVSVGEERERKAF